MKKPLKAVHSKKLGLREKYKYYYLRDCLKEKTLLSMEKNWNKQK